MGFVGFLGEWEMRRREKKKKRREGERRKEGKGQGGERFLGVEMIVLMSDFFHSKTPFLSVAE